MRDINIVFLIGRLTRDPEFRYTANQQAICKFSIANNRSYIAQGNKIEETSYFDIVVWAKLAEVCNEYLKKGKQIAVEGRLVQNRWTDQEGKTRSKVEIVASNVQFLSAPVSGQNQMNNNAQDFSAPNSAEYSNQGYSNQNYPQNNSVMNEGNNENSGSSGFSDDDIPF